MRRRDLIAMVGGAAVVWPLAARAQQPDRKPRIDVLMGYAEKDLDAKAQLSAFTHRLHELGWTEGRNVRMDFRWASGNVDQVRMFARELVDLQPDVILAQTTPVTAALQQETRTIPIIFVVVVDPVGSGFVASLTNPGGNLTGFLNLEASLSSKWLELLKEVAPGVTRAALLFNPETAPRGGTYHLPVAEAAAESLAIKPIAAPVHDDDEIERVISSLGREPGGGLVVLPDLYVAVHRASIIAAAARNNVPAVYDASFFVRDGGLLGYGPDEPDIFQRSASYVDRILRGEKPRDLPVQAPTKFELMINLKTAKALGLTIPFSLLARADAVIE
jgi:putative ABC transport system substrate-binding protein